MKNAKKLVLAALMVAVMAFALCACGSSGVTGTYVVTEVNGQNVDDALAQLKEAGSDMTAEQLCTITLNDGNSFTMTVMGTEMGSGTYEISGETITLTANNQPQTGTIKDGVITISVNNSSMTLKKK